MITHPQQLNELSLFSFPKLFATLDVPVPDRLQGLYQGEFVGPGWVRGLAGPLLVLTGLGGWWGKDFSPGGQAVNLVYKNERIERRFPMQLVPAVSYIDQKSGLALHYDRRNPFPWPWIVDELRSLGPDLLLGMTLVRFGPLRRLALPFTLAAREDMNGL